MQVKRVSLAEWAEILPADEGEVFHRPEVLEVLDEHAPGEFQLYCGFTGEEPVGLMPVFVREVTVGRAVLSPPPGFSVPRLGPVMRPTSPKRRKREELNRAFTEGVLEATDAKDTLTLFWMIGGVGYTDPRPYMWEDFDVTLPSVVRLRVRWCGFDGIST